LSDEDLGRASQGVRLAWPRATALRARDVAIGLVLASVVIGAVLAPAARAGWSKPFQFAKPGSLDTIPVGLAFSPQGASAAAFGVEDVDNPALSSAFVTLRAPGGAVGAPRQVPGAQQLLGIAFDGPSLELLTATSRQDLACCSQAEAVRVGSGGAFAPPRTLVSELDGTSLGQLVTLADGQMVAAIASSNGVWAAQSVSGDRFAGAHRLTVSSDLPETLASTSLGGEKSIVAWTTGSGAAGEASPRSIYAAIGSRLSAPRRSRALVTLPATRRIDELAVAARGSIPTLAWIQSWFDNHGDYHAQAEAADIGPRPQVRALSPAGQVASGLALAGDANGDQAVAWKICASDGTCTLHVSARGAKAVFGQPVSLGSIDPSQTPSLSVGPDGEALVGWVRLGHPVAAVSRPASTRFGPTLVLSATTYALDLAVSFGPRHEGLAAWTQGTLAPSVVGAAYHG
jgi:hypothetical protein